MVFNRFSLNVIILSLLVSITGTLFIWTLTQDYLVISRITSAALWLIFVIRLINFVNRTNRGLSTFLQSVKTLDSTKPEAINPGGTFKMLDISYAEILNSIQDVKIEKEIEYQFFRSVIENVATGLISFDNEGSIEMINRSAVRLLNCGQVTQIKSLNKTEKDFGEFLIKLRPGINALRRIIVDEEVINLSVRKAEFTRKSEKISLISLQNISKEMEEQEIIAWQKLIAVLTHEIMNSVSPIKSLSTTLKGILSNSPNLSVSNADGESINTDLIAGLSAIETRSKGLMQFVESYRRLSRIPEPQFSEHRVADIFKNIISLMQSETGSKGIGFSAQTEPGDLTLCCDEKLVSQLLINLVSNSVFAIKNTSGGEIRISAYPEKQGHVAISVSDNGTGINPEIIEKIFIPFYTTRENGSGIGLSLVRQIMLLHQGTVKVISIPGLTTFTLTF
jgi:two-component system, NtrC family, nitrogen regulation sensor histidine kinase NtrY